MRSLLSLTDRTSTIVIAAAVGFATAGGCYPAVRAQAMRTVWDGVYTDEQAKRGAVLFDRECAQCHGPAGEGGGMAPALVDSAFAANYEGLTVGDLFDRNRVTMPVGKEGQLSGQENADITAFMLQCNTFPSGSLDLPSQTVTLKQIKYITQKPEARQPGAKPPGVHQDDTEGKEWIRRLERPDRLPGLRIADVISALQLRPGDVVADIGAGTGAYTIPFAKAIAPSGIALAVDIHQDLLDYIEVKRKREDVSTLRTILARLDDPNLPTTGVDVAFFHDVFHNVNDRQAYLQVLTSYLKPNGRIAIVEQEFDDPIARKWDRPEDRITRAQLNVWMAKVGFRLTEEFDLFQGHNNPKGAGMPERWFVVYARDPSSSR